MAAAGAQCAGSAFIFFAAQAECIGFETCIPHRDLFSASRLVLNIPIVISGVGRATARPYIAITCNM